MRKFNHTFIKSSKLALLSLLCVATFVTPVFAESKSVSVTSEGKLGAVEISYVDDAKEPTGPVLPGYEMELNGAVVNNAEPCWIRVKVEYDAQTDGSESQKTSDGVERFGFDESCINLADDNWKHIGDYYYYPSVVENKEKVDFVKSVKTPVDWGNEASDVTFSTYYTAEAVQAKNFTPDFNSDDPWYGTVIQAFDTSDYKMKEAGNAQFQIICDSSSKELVAVGDDFFSNWETMMPGDTLTGELTISNKMEVPVKMYFNTKTTADEDLLKNLHMVIKNDDKVVFDSAMTSDVDPEVLLQEYAAGTSSKMTYELTIPKELDNAYALKELKAVWTFRADVPEQHTNEPEKTDRQTPNVATGDVAMGGLVVGMIAAAGILLIAVLVKKRKETN